MTIAEYNAYIKNYLDNDKTKSAIMLTAPWGMGKSYYIQNSLIPYLNGFERKTCIVVSLYGMKDTGEISKSIYLELRMKQLKKIGEKTNTGLLAAKTLVKGVAGFFGIGLDINSKDLEKLYSSVNLSGKLIILEDLERTDIDIKQILGYVNNLVEQDGVKVLLVANESAILKYREEPGRDKDGNEIKTKVLSQESQEYLTIKEKTVSDTILFICDFSEAIKNILKQFDNEHINACLSADEQGLILEIQDIMTKIGEYNLRSLLFACQKVADIYNYCHETVNSDYFRTVFLSAVAFSLRLKRNDKLEWSKDMTADKLGTTKYPLYRYCYDYIKYQEFDVFEIKETEKAFIEQEEAKRTQKDIYDKLNVLV